MPVGKRTRESCCAGSSPAHAVAALPVVVAVVNGRRVRALVDTGCSKSIVAKRLSGWCQGSCVVIAVDGSRVQCPGETIATISVGGASLQIPCIVADKLLPGVEAILGMDVVTAFGGIRVSPGRVDFLFVAPGTVGGAVDVARAMSRSGAACDGGAACGGGAG